MNGTGRARLLAITFAVALVGCSDGGAQKDRESFLLTLASEGLRIQDTDVVVERGRAVCTSLEDGTPVPEVTQAVMDDLGLTPNNGQFFVEAAQGSFCPEVQAVFEEPGVGEDRTIETDEEEVPDPAEDEELEGGSTVEFTAPPACLQAYEAALKEDKFVMMDGEDPATISVGTAVVDACQRKEDFWAAAELVDFESDYPVEVDRTAAAACAHALQGGSDGAQIADTPYCRDYQRCLRTSDAPAFCDAQLPGWSKWADPLGL